jgi:hypothetical protein
MVGYVEWMLGFGIMKLGRQIFLLKKQLKPPSIEILPKPEKVKKKIMSDCKAIFLKNRVFSDKKS